MESRLKKTERLIKMWSMIHNNANGYTVRELSERFEVTIRTIYRDLDTLQYDLKVPLYDENKRWKLDTSRILPPMRLTVPEALNIFLAARLMVSYDMRYDPNMDATFSKLASILPKPLAEQVQKTMDWMRGMPQEGRYQQVLSDLANAWVNQRRVIISYRSYEAEESSERMIDPYFIQPAATGHATYVVAYCHRTSEIRSFRVGRIENIRLTDETYTIPSDFNANKYFGPAWGISVEGEARTVKLKFSPQVKRLIMETVWHPSQVLEEKRDGSVLMTLTVMDTIEFFRWILWWGSDVEVIEPEEMREELLNTSKSMVKVYRGK